MHWNTINRLNTSYQRCMGQTERGNAKNMQNVFQIVINYLTETLISQGILEAERSDLCGFKILEKILFREDCSTEEEKTNRENLRNWVNKGTIPDKNWIEFVCEKEKCLTDEDFLYIVGYALQKDPNGKTDDYDYSLNRVEDQFLRELNPKLDACIGYNRINKNATTISRIILCIIHGLYGKVKQDIPCGVQTTFYLDRNIGVEIKEEWNFVWVTGAAYSGKTSWLLNYAQKQGEAVVYCRNPESYEEIIEKITIEEDSVLDKDARKKLGCHFRRSIEGKKERIKKLVKSFVLIIDGGNLKTSDYTKLIELSETGKVQILVETRLNVDENRFEQPVISIPSFKKEEAIDLFYLVSAKYRKGKISEKKEDLDAMLSDVCRKVFNNPGLIILLAENFWSRIKRNDTESGKQAALSLLNEIIELQPLGAGDEIEWGEKCSSSLHYSKGKQSQNKLDGHIRFLFENCAQEIEKSAFYVLSLLDGIKLEQRYLENWFGISKNIIQTLEEDGWCTIDQDNLTVEIPQLIVRALKADVHKNFNTSRVFSGYIKNLSITLNRMEIEPADVGTIQQVILQLHNIFVGQLKNPEMVVKDEWFEFHFTCVRYFLYYGDVVQAEQLEKMAGLKAEDDDGIQAYQGALDAIKACMGKNNTIDLISGIVTLLNGKKVFCSEMETRAFMYAIFLYSEKCLIGCIACLYDGNVEVHARNQMQIEGLNIIYRIMVENSRDNDEIRKMVYLYDMAFRTLRDFDQWSLFMVRDRIKFWLQFVEDVSAGEGHRVCEVEKTIYQNSIALLMLDELYIYIDWAFNRKNNSEDENEPSNQEQLDLSDYIKDTRLKIQEIAKQIIKLKNRIHELPCNCAGMCLLASAIAGVILQDKSLMQVSDYDFKHLTLYDEQERKRLKDIIFNCRKWGMKEEE